MKNILLTFNCLFNFDKTFSIVVFQTNLIDHVGSSKLAMMGIFTPWKLSSGYKTRTFSPGELVVQHFSACYRVQGIKTGKDSGQ